MEQLCRELDGQVWGSYVGQGGWASADATGLVSGWVDGTYDLADPDSRQVSEQRVQRRGPTSLTFGVLRRAIVGTATSERSARD